MLIRNTKVVNISDKPPKIISYKIGKLIDMNRTIISIEIQDHSGKEANIIVRGERNNQIMSHSKIGLQHLINTKLSVLIKNKSDIGLQLCS
jgi:hypothetical protein